jgi:hypothetical protein
VAGYYQVHLVPSEEDCWTSSVLGNDCTIGFVESQRPRSDFTHELLHAKLIHDGIRQPGHAQFGVFATEDEAGEFCGQLYNDLVHHKMLPLFVQMGFPASEFLHQDDRAQTLVQLNQLLPQLEQIHAQAHQPIRILALGALYMYVSNPHDAADLVFAPYRQPILAIADPALVQGIDALLTDWAATASLDCRSFMARFFKVCGETEIAFGWDDNSLIAASDV